MTEALFVPSLFRPFLSEKYEIHGNRSVILCDFYPLKELKLFYLYFSTP